MKMADVDIDPSGEHDKADEYPGEDETIPFYPGRSDWRIYRTPTRYIIWRNENKNESPERIH